MTRVFIMELLVAVHVAATAIAASGTAKEAEEGELYTLNGKKQGYSKANEGNRQG